jgi:hypothetical protein
MGSRSPLAAAPRMLDARRVLRSSVRSSSGRAATTRSSTVLSIDMVSGSYAARLKSASQNMARLPVNPLLRRPCGSKKCSKCGSPVQSCLHLTVAFTVGASARLLLHRGNVRRLLQVIAPPAACGQRRRSASYSSSGSAFLICRLTSPGLIPGRTNSFPMTSATASASSPSFTGALLRTSSIALSLSGSYARKFRTIRGFPSESKVVTRMFHPAGIVFPNRCTPRAVVTLN